MGQKNNVLWTERPGRNHDGSKFLGGSSQAKCSGIVEKVVCVTSKARLLENK